MNLNALWFGFEQGVSLLLWACKYAFCAAWKHSPLFCFCFLKIGKTRSVRVKLLRGANVLSDVLPE